MRELLMNAVFKEGAPLTQAQHGIWSGQQLNKSSSRYNAADAIEIRSELNTGVFEKALNQVIEEATALHISFKETGNGVLQFLHDKDWELFKQDFSHCNAPHKEAFNWMKHELKTVVCLEKGPLFKQVLLKIADDHFIWYYRIHHIASDGYAFALLSQRVSDVYNTMMGQNDNGTPDRSFAAYNKLIEEDQKYLQSDTYKKSREYWINHLRGMKPPVSLSDSSAPIQESSLRKSCKISKKDFQAIKDLSVQYNCNWSDLILALVYTVIFEKTGAEEITLGMPVMGRMGSPALRIPAMVMNIVPLRLLLTKGDRISDLAEKVSVLLKETRPHQKYRYEQLRRDLKIMGGKKSLYGPVVNIMPFERQITFGEGKTSIQNLSAGPVEDISFGFVTQQDEELLFELDANPERYSMQDLDSLQSHFQDILRKVKKDGDYQPVIHVQDFSWLEGTKLHLKHETLTGFLLEKMKTAPDKVAIMDGDKQLTYEQLFYRVRRMAAALSRKGVGKNNLVALALPRGEQAVICNIALLLMGSAYVFIDSGGPEERNRKILSDASPDLIICNEEHRIWGNEGKGISIKALDENDAGLVPVTGFEYDDSQPAYYIYTSGSTGKPKGVQISRKALYGFIVGAIEQYDIQKDDRILQFAPLHFDTSVEEIFIGLCSTATLVIRSEEMIDSIPAFLQACEQLRISILDLPTAYWHELVYCCSAKKRTIPECIRTLIIGGEAALEERVQQWHQIVDGKIKLLNTYGPSETTVVATCSDLKPGQKLSIGSPLPGRQIAVADSENSIVGYGKEGELFILGAGLGDGYLNLAEQTKEKFINLFIPWSGKYEKAYKSGDRVKINREGTVDFIGRIDNELKISGLRINPHEIESALLSIEQVREAAIIVNQTNDGQKHLVACLAVDETYDLANIRLQMQRSLPKPMIPSVFKRYGTLPKNQAGKVDRLRLKQQTGTTKGAGALQRVTETERIIIQTWQEVLGLDSIAVHDDFFMLGGQSLQTIQVANRLSTAFKQEIPVNLLFENPTVSDLALMLSNSGTGKNQSIKDIVISDCALPDDIFPGLPLKKEAVIKPDGVNTVLLTGATGFVGAQLLHELVQHKNMAVICLVRASNIRNGQNRIAEAMQAQNLCIQDWERVEIVPGDLEKMQLGLSDETFGKISRKINTILHSAAITSVVRDYQSLRAANVMAVRELLRLTAGKSIPFHHISTIAVGTGELHEDFVDWHAGLQDGYQQSKWAAEQLVKTAMERGCPSNVYRLARVTGDLNTGFVNHSDLVWNIIRSSARIGYYPLLNIKEPWTPVDIIAKAIVNHVVKVGTMNKIYNLTPDNQVQLQQLFGWLKEYNFRLNKLPVEDWCQKLSQSKNDEDLALYSFFQQQKSRNQLKVSFIHNTKTKKELFQNTSLLPEIKQESFERYMEYAIRNGLPENNLEKEYSIANK